MSIVAAYVVPHPPLIVPAVGHGQERAIQATVDAYEEVARRIAAHAPDTIVVVSPHAPLYYDCFHISTGDAAHGDMGRFDAWEAAMNVPYDPSFAAAVSACARARGVPICGSGMRDGELDHATFVPLHFVNERYAGYRLVRVGLSGLTPADHREVGRCVAEAACDLDRTCVLVASGDLSHKLKEDGPYGFAPEGPVFDRTVTGLFDEGDLEGLFSIDAAFREAAAECGLGSFQIMAGALDGVPLIAIGVSYFLVRILGKYAGAWLGCLVTGRPKELRRYLGLALIPQAGVAIGLAALGARTLGGTMGSDLQTIILASSVLYELMGPGCAKLALYLSKSYSTKLEDVAVVPEVNERGERKSDAQLLIERVQKIRQELPKREPDMSEEEAAFLEAAEEQLAPTQAQRRYFYLRRK